MSEPVAGTRASAFNPRTMLLVAIIGIVAFIATLLLSAYAPELRSGGNGGGHALSNAAIGFSGVVRLASDTGRHVRVIRYEREYGGDDLLVLTPETGDTDVSKPLDVRASLPTLLVLPKWETMPDPDHQGWVRSLGPVGSYQPQSVLAPNWNLMIRRQADGGKGLSGTGIATDIHFAAPRPIQVITGFLPGDKKAGDAMQRLEPVVVDGNGFMVVARLGKGPLYVLSDPDLLSNIGMKDPHQALAALQLLDRLDRRRTGSIRFDVTLNGLGHSRNPLQLIFDPPFLAVTLTLAVAMLLAAVQALVRFGAASRRERAIAFGKRALVDNSAAMIRKAGYEARMGTYYADLVREQAAAAFSAPAALRSAALDAYLDGLGGERRFSTLAYEVSIAASREELAEAARALQAWKKEKMR